MSLEELILLYRNESNRVIIGTRRTIKFLKLGKIKKVYIVKNAPENIKRDIEYYSKIASIEVEMLDITNEELGASLKKPFKISVIGILK